MDPIVQANISDTANLIGAVHIGQRTRVLVDHERYWSMFRGREGRNAAEPLFLDFLASGGLAPEVERALADARAALGRARRPARRGRAVKRKVPCEDSGAAGFARPVPALRRGAPQEPTKVYAATESPREEVQADGGDSPASDQSQRASMFTDGGRPAKR